MKEHVDKTFPSFCGGSHAERREDFDKWCRGHLDELPPFEVVEAAVAKGIEIYNNTPHSAPDMFGYTPLYALEKFRDGPARKKSDDVLDYLFGEFIGPKLVRRDGIHWLGEVFGFGDLRMVACQGRKLWLCVQPEEVHSVLVCDEKQSAMFHADCGNNVIRTKRDLEEHQKMRARLRRGAFKIARDARKVFKAIPPEEQLANREAGLAALHGKPLVPQPAPILAIIDPDIEDALSKAGPAPSEGVSIAVRTGTEDLPLEDFLDDDPGSSWASQLAAGVADDDGDGSLIPLDDLTGE